MSITLSTSTNWLKWFTPDKTIAVRAIVSQAPAFNNSAFVALKVKDAIADQFRDHYNKRSYVDKSNPVNTPLRRA